MDMLRDQIPPAPVDMVMPEVYGRIVVSTYVVLAVVVLIILNEIRKSRSPLPILMLLGGMLSCLTEPLWDVLGSIWYPQYGHVPMYRLFNMSIPWWVMGGYSLYVGGLGYWFYRQMQKGLTHKKFWIIYAIGWIANFLVEIPVLQAKVYIYHGPQPLMFLGFPLWQAMGNALMPIMSATIVHVWRDYLSGARMLLVIPIMPAAVTMTLTTVGLPTFLAVNSGYGLAVTTPASVLSLGIALTMASMIAHKICQPNAATVTPAVAA